jgi:hypothetical protein
MGEMTAVQREMPAMIPVRGGLRAATRNLGCSATRWTRTRGRRG